MMPSPNEYANRFYRLLFMAALEQDRCQEVAEALFSHQRMRLEESGRLTIGDPIDDER